MDLIIIVAVLQLAQQHAMVGSGIYSVMLYLYLINMLRK